MQPSTFRLPDDEALVQAAWQRASAAHARLTDVARQVTVANAARRAQGHAMIEVGQFSPPQATPHVPAADVARLLDGQAQWFEQEAARLEAQVAATQRPTANAGEPEAVLGPGPRPVPFALCFAEVARGPWLWLRWLLFPPITMGFGVAFVAAAAASSPAAVALVVVLLAALWGYGLTRGVARIVLLSRGEVATVLQRTQHIGATRNRNVPMLAARGWDVTVESFSGRSRRTDLVVQTSRGVIGKVSVRHGPDFHGVVLVDPETGAGCTNLDLGSVARPGRDGQWQTSLPARVWITSALAPVVSAAILGAVLLATR